MPQQAFFTCTFGMDVDYFHPANTVQDPLLRQAAQNGLTVWQKLMGDIFSSGNASGIRKQNGLAAAAEGLSIGVWNQLSENEQEALRLKWTDHYRGHDITQPSLVFYIGSKLTDDKHSSSPSTSTVYDIASTPLQSIPQSDIDISAQHETAIWDQAWEHSALTNDWAWIMRAHNRPEHPLVFLSGAYAIWPRVVRSIKDQQKLDIFLHIAMYREFIHLVVGDQNPGDNNIYVTPHRMSSNPDPNSVNGRDGKEMKEGDAGEMAEAMGYGGVVNMTYQVLKASPGVKERITALSLVADIWHQGFCNSRTLFDSDVARLLTSSDIPLHSEVGIPTPDSGTVPVTRAKRHKHPTISLSTQLATAIADTPKNWTRFPRRAPPIQYVNGLALRS